MPRAPPGAVWKRSTSACRASAFAMLPSMRQKFQPRALTAAWNSRNNTATAGVAAGGKQQLRQQQQQD